MFHVIYENQDDYTAAMITDSSLLFASFQWLCPASGKNVEIQHDWIRDRSFPFFVIMVPEDGVYLAQIENSSSIITVHPGEALVIPPRMVHSVVCPEKCRLNYAYPFFQLQGWFDPFIKRKMPLVFLGSDAVFLKKNITGYSENSAQSLSRAAAIFSFLHERSEANLDPFEDVAHKEDVEKVIVFLEQHYQEKLSRSD